MQLELLPNFLTVCVGRFDSTKPQPALVCVGACALGLLQSCWGMAGKKHSLLPSPNRVPRERGNMGSLALCYGLDRRDHKGKKLFGVFWQIKALRESSERPVGSQHTMCLHKAAYNPFPGSAPSPLAFFFFFLSRSLYF